METNAFFTGAIQQILEKLDSLSRKLDEIKPSGPLKREWLDLQETCHLLNLSKRTLQTYRNEGILPYSQIGGKIYFRASDIEGHLERNYTRRSKKSTAPIPDPSPTRGKGFGFTQSTAPIPNPSPTRGKGLVLRSKTMQRSEKSSIKHRKSMYCGTIPDF